MINWRNVKVSSAFFGLVIMLSLYNHCTGQFGDGNAKGLKFKNNTTTSNSTTPPPASPSALPPDSRAVSLESFGASVHPITRARCLACHANLIRPFHASGDVAQAHDEIINNAKVNLTDPAQSRLVLKLRDGHNCWGNCTSNADEMLAAVQVWKQAMDNWQDEQDREQEAPSSSNNNLTTAEQGPFDLLANSQMSGQNITLRPEQFSVFSPMVLFSQGSDAYIWVPNGNSGSARTATDPAAGIARATVNIPQTASYKFYALVDAPNTSDNSLYLIPKTGTTISWRLESSLTKGMEWREVTNGADELDVSTTLNAGANTIEIRQREDGMKLAGLLISSDPNVDLADLSLGQKIVLQFSLNSILNIAATIEMTIEEFDDYTYKVSNARLISPRPIEIRGIRFLVNGTYNPQHSTYTYVNQVYGSGNVSISPSSMLVLKDQGTNVDRFSLQFEAIRVVP